MKQWIHIDGSIEANVNNVEFNKAFIKWVESQGWLFAGVTKDEDKEEING